MNALAAHPRLADALFGTDERLRVRVRLSLMASGMYALWVGVMLFGLDHDLVASHPLAWTAIALLVLAMSVFYPLVRSGRTAHLADPALVLPQIMLAYAGSAIGYVAMPDTRGPLLQVMCLIQVFGLLSLTPAEVRLGGLAGVISLGVAWCVGALFAPTWAFDPLREAILLATAAFVMSLLTLMSHSYSGIRNHVRQQKIELGAAVAQVEHIVSHDVLTGLPNRHHMIGALERELSRADRSGQRFAVVIIDLDHFKQVNDTHGHGVGDEVLEAFAGIAREVLRDTDILGRWGGEEFLVLMPDAQPAAQAAAGLQRLRDTLVDTIVSSTRPDLRLRFSAGVAVPCHGETIDGVLERADNALYQAKREGRDQTVIAP